MLAEMMRTAKAFFVCSTDGVAKLNRKGRMMISTTAKDMAGNLSSALYSLVVSETDVDVGHHMLHALRLFYGPTLKDIGLMRVDGGFALNSVGKRFVESLCAGGGVADEAAELLLPRC